MLKVKTVYENINGEAVDKPLKEYSIIQGDTFTLNLVDNTNSILGANFKLGNVDGDTQHFDEVYVRPFYYSDIDEKWICLVPTADTNEWDITKDAQEGIDNPYVYEIEATLADRNKLSITRQFFNVEKQVGDN